MSEFERKPDGGLSAWIETYEAMGGGENDAEMLCLLLELRRRRENQAEAERERDELRAERLADKVMISYQGDCIINAESAMRESQEELARRDAAASEPVAWISDRNLKNLGKAFSVVVKHEPVMVRPIALYTTAPPAVVSDETLRDVIRAWSAAPYPGPYVYEKMRKALGAQPPKPVAEVEELSMQIRRLVHSLKNSNHDSSLLKSVPDYMQRKGYWKATDCLRGEHD